MEVVKIKKITKLEQKLDRYDLTINTTHNFFANGILIHNTSSIHGNVLVKNIKQLHCGVVCINKRIKREIKTLAKSNPTQYHKKREKEVKITQLKRLIKPTYSIGYGNVYSSRNVIKNKFIHKGVSQGFYGQDVWGDVNAIISPFIEKGMIIYGEIVGYITNSDKMIQSPFDYGCKVGTNYFMPYRITTTNADNSKKEWNVMDVYDWTVKLLKNNPSLEGKVKPLTIFYHGTLGDLYPNIPTENHWHENVLEAMKNDKEHFGMEELEPLCHNKCPREGIVMRKENDPLTEAFKLKCVKFLEKERDMIDKGEFVDMEMQEALQEN